MEGSKPIRVLTCYYRPKPGGFCKRYFRAINALLDQGCEVHYLAVVPFPIDRPGIYFHRFPWPRDKTDTLFFWAVFHLLAPCILIYLGFRWRVSHCFAFGTNYGCMLQPIRSLKRIPLALYLRADTVENHRIKGHPEWLILFETLIEGIALKGARLFSVSEVLSQTVLARHRFLKPRLASTHRNDLEVVKSVRRRDKNYPIRLACVGVLEKRKNQAFLLDCLAALMSKDIVLNIYGIGPDEIMLRRLVKNLELDGCVHFNGWVAASEIWPNADILLMPSLHEGAPNAVLEALARRIPILASDIPEHREILPSYNLVRPNDREAWCCRLRAIINAPNTELRRLEEVQNSCLNSLIFDWDKQTCISILGN
ncbi:MAG: glycosyltransferase family 4 protein [Gammaproteobacteria bacterium]